MRPKEGAFPLLFLTCHLPYPPYSGGRVRDYELLKRICRETDVHLCAVSKTYEEDVRNAAELSGLCASVEVCRASGASARSSRANDAAQVLRHASPSASAYVDGVLDDGVVDLVHVEGFYLLQHVPHGCPVPTLLVEQNVEYALWRQRAENARDAEERVEALRQFRLTRKAEIAAWREADLCAVVTEDDRSEMLAAVPELDVRVLPDGADHIERREAAGSFRRRSDRPTVVFVANFAYQPNVDAAFYLCDAILPLVAAEVPSVRFELVGNAPPAELAARSDERIVVTGRVPAVEPFLDSADVVACPLRVGGGVKVKVLEALARGKAIVTTSVGAQGLGPGMRAAACIEDDAAGFATAVAELLRNPSKRRTLERRASAFAATALPRWDETAAALLGCYDELRTTRLVGADASSSS
ncbi:MAG: glycosyltransferase family 4 protein [Actinomycetota bacterium]|nr:glycosyltransferase family 4 protein [Actinomycetota bacterium]